jgi:hypothetical protein
MSQFDPTATLAARVRGVSYLIRQRTLSVKVQTPDSHDQIGPLLDFVLNHPC